MTVFELKNIHEAERTYANTYSKGFTKDLDSLAAPPQWLRPNEDHAGLLPLSRTPFLKDQDAAHFTEHGYRFTYRPAKAGADGKIAGYTVSARPIQFGNTGNRNFLLDESGKIHATSADKPATAEDPLLRDIPPTNAATKRSVPFRHPRLPPGHQSPRVMQMEPASTLKLPFLEAACTDRCCSIIPREEGQFLRMIGHPVRHGHTG